MNNSVNCRPVWLPAYALQWAGGEYADVALGEGPSCVPWSTSSSSCSQLTSFAYTHLGNKSLRMLCRRPGLLLCGSDQPAHGGPDIPAAGQDGAAHVVRRFALQSCLMASAWRR